MWGERKHEELSSSLPVWGSGDRTQVVKLGSGWLNLLSNSASSNNAFSTHDTNAENTLLRLPYAKRFATVEAKRA